MGREQNKIAKFLDYFHFHVTVVNSQMKPHSRYGEMVGLPFRCGIGYLGIPVVL